MGAHSFAYGSEAQFVPVFSSLLRASPLVNCGSLGLPRIALGLDEASQVIEEQVWNLEGFLLKARVGACSSWHPLGGVASVSGK